ncbi:uncharacterized protein LOC125321328 isoform X2 [Corvus hawaiiensis]|uniref:uncharacterized protein LOC125321328 isoform X2 n=1 Tax=Corvus hawaiiensis TaxID=134902 RepID=UPI00201908CD|nr:uncharacterized protein LOC125321328 isoform X2 [Corvus hawaiiensis]
MPFICPATPPSAAWPEEGREGSVENGSSEAWRSVSAGLLPRREVRVRVHGAALPNRSAPSVTAARAPEEGAGREKRKGRSGNTERNAVPRSRKLDGGRHGRTARASWAGASPRPARAQGQASRHLHAENPRQVRCYHVAAARHESLIPLLVSIVVSIPACHAGDRGSIPRRGGGVGAFFSLETGRWNPPPTCFSLSGPHPQRSSCWETRQSVQSWEQREGIGGCLRSGRPAAS